MGAFFSGSVDLSTGAQISISDTFFSTNTDILFDSIVNGFEFYSVNTGSITINVN